jgi:pimeloyl-ACP methyl ester carboxylesterase
VTQQIQVDGASLAYTDRGSGEAVVLVHGSASDQRSWQGQLDALASGHRVIAYSRRYHWPNTPIAAGVDYAMAEHVADLAALLRSLGAAPAHLIGHSYGGFVALLLALQQPALVRSLVLAEPPLITLFVSNRPRARQVLRLLLTRPRTALALVRFGATGMGPATAAARRGDMEQAMRRMGHAVLGPAAYARLSASRLAQVRANAVPAEFLGSGFAPLDGAALRGVQVPVLLVQGQHSPRLFHRLLDALQALLPEATRVTIAQASHLMHEDNALAYNAAVLQHLQRPRPGR